MNEAQASYLRAVGLDEDRDALRDAAIHLRRSGLDEMADRLESALLQYDGAKSESRRFLDTRQEETERLQAAEQRAALHHQFAAKLLDPEGRYAIVDRETGEQVSGDGLKALLEGCKPEQGQVQVERPRTLLGGARL